MVDLNYSLNDLTNRDLKLYNAEYDRLRSERNRIDLQIEAILTTSALKLEEEMNKRRLDYAHLSNAYSAFVQNDLESMQFAIVDQTIRDLFFLNPDKFEFVTIEPYDSGTFEYLYKYEDRTISIKIPSAPLITKDNVESLDWGLITVYEVFNLKNSISESVGVVQKEIVIRSDDVTLIARKIADYLSCPKGVSVALL